MAKNTGKVIENIKVVLGMVQTGEGGYSVDAGLGKLCKNGKPLKGSVGSEDGQQWYTVKGMNLQGQKLMYAYYHGVDALDPAQVIKHLDGDKLRNTVDNLVQVPKKGWKQALEAKREGLNLEAVSTEGAPAPATPAPVQPEAPVATEEPTYTEKELEARKIWMELHGGATIKEVASKLGVKESRVYDVKRGKSNASAVADLPALA